MPILLLLLLFIICWRTDARKQATILYRYKCQYKYSHLQEQFLGQPQSAAGGASSCQLGSVCIFDSDRDLMNRGPGGIIDYIDWFMWHKKGSRSPVTAVKIVRPPSWLPIGQCWQYCHLIGQNSLIPMPAFSRIYFVNLQTQVSKLKDDFWFTY